MVLYQPCTLFGATIDRKNHTVTPADRTYFVSITPAVEFGVGKDQFYWSFSKTHNGKAFQYQDQLKETSPCRFWTAGTQCGLELASDATDLCLQISGTSTQSPDAFARLRHFIENFNATRWGGPHRNPYQNGNHNIGNQNYGNQNNGNQNYGNQNNGQHYAYAGGQQQPGHPQNYGPQQPNFGGPGPQQPHYGGPGQGPQDPRYGSGPQDPRYGPQQPNFGGKGPQQPNFGGPGPRFYRKRFQDQFAHVSAEQEALVKQMAALPDQVSTVHGTSTWFLPAVIALAVVASLLAIVVVYFSRRT
jgi:hypothetical protein